jgi:hypothetical protein
MTVAMLLGIIMAVMMLAVVNQQLAFLKIYRAQSFISEDAPLIGMHVGRLAGKADRFRLHASVADALSGSNPRLTASPVMVMNFRQPDGTMRAAILAFETMGGQDYLNYYVVPTSGVLGAAQWYVSKRVRVDSTRYTDVSGFTVEQGVLRMRLVGPVGEQITYSGTMQQ